MNETQPDPAVYLGATPTGALVAPLVPSDHVPAWLYPQESVLYISRAERTDKKRPGLRRLRAINDGKQCPV